MVNRVATARATYELLAKTLKVEAEVELLIGRTRPLDRDEYMRELTPKLESSTEPRVGDKPIVVVATQTIEVGADFDFHALFVEAASYASLKQRVGRLNRLGVRDEARGAIVLVTAEAEDDPLYGKTISATWSLLETHARDGLVDLGISTAPGPTKATEVEKPSTPQLSPSLLNLLVQTSPKPAVEPDVAELLHGFATQPPDVSVVWRDGLVGTDGELQADRAKELLRVLPPLATEAMSLPYATFRQWVARWGSKKPRKLVDGGDVEGEAQPESDREELDAWVVTVDSDEIRVEKAERVHPGALVVIPTTRGGADRFGWRPDDASPVSDLSLQAREQPRRERVLVWTREIADAWLQRAPQEAADDDTKPVLDALADPDASLSEARGSLNDWFAASAARLPPNVVELFEQVRDRRAEWLETGDQKWGVLLRDGRVTGADLVEGAELQRSVRVPLVDHLRKVGELAERFARGVGLPESLVAVLRVAGGTHDMGKADPRFQRRLSAEDGQLLAKSDTYDCKAPRGERHEVYSVAVLDQHPVLCEAVAEHRDLVRYLVGTHHGYGRGLHPTANDPGISFDAPYAGQMFSYVGRPAMYALGSGWADLFVSQNRTYGPWLLAYLEAILRLADHRRSELEIEECGGER